MNRYTIEHHVMVILGGGPAGLTAAIYAARAHLNPLVIRGPNPGGQLIQTSTVENYPGFANGVLGPALMEQFEIQASRFGTEMRYGVATQVNFSNHPLELLIDDAYVLQSDAVVIATGASPQWLGLDNEQRLVGRGVSTCAICDGAFFKDQLVAVIGGGDAALENALSLTRFSSHVYVIHRRNQLRASKEMQKLAFQHEKISVVWNTRVMDIVGEDNVKALILEEVNTEASSCLLIQGVFIAIGHRPNTEIFRPWLQMDEQGYILTQPDSTHTSVAGVFACGDARDKIYRQAITAAGTGCMAALDAERWLQKAGLIR
ncbi:MAG TPA: thioredoxin-disulfide reductase [Leptolyngbyaceae cyanobacterium M33_DOE_097]|uniref:Thioredoxin reductase n=1 Tax=Oscillatoriales cyanobacterium SpSt-418 TaxID=2282169 RepID=A0A7C3KIZ4_9CYAN|nr:thioredoxin-disulfide reductase [Leptolyngbyaceae cyanobacterium M33_DOE_097]